MLEGAGGYDRGAPRGDEGSALQLRVRDRGHGAGQGSPGLWVRCVGCRRRPRLIQAAVRGPQPSASDLCAVRAAIAEVDCDRGTPPDASQTGMAHERWLPPASLCNYSPNVG